MGRKNLPCSTVKAQTENSTGAFLASRSRTSSSVSESLPPESATATRSPSRIILNRAMASPVFRSSVFSRSNGYPWPPGLSMTEVHKPAQSEDGGHEPGEAVGGVAHALVVRAFGHHAQHDRREQREQHGSFEMGKADFWHAPL